MSAHRTCKHWGQYFLLLISHSKTSLDSSYMLHKSRAHFSHGWRMIMRFKPYVMKSSRKWSLFPCVSMQWKRWLFWSPCLYISKPYCYVVFFLPCQCLIHHIKIPNSYACMVHLCESNVIRWLHPNINKGSFIQLEFFLVRVHKSIIHYISSNTMSIKSFTT